MRKFVFLVTHTMQSVEIKYNSKKLVTIFHTKKQLSLAYAGK